MTIKAFVALITPDSVKILDVIKKVVRLRSVSYLQEQVHLPVDFGAVQDLLIGNPVYSWIPRTSSITGRRRRACRSSALGRFFTNFLTLNPDNTINHSKLDDVDPLRARTCDITYGDYDYGQGQAPAPFSTYRKISVAEKRKGGYRDRDQQAL